MQYRLLQALGYWDLEVHCSGTFPFLQGSVVTPDEMAQIVERIAWSASLPSDNKSASSKAGLSTLAEDAVELRLGIPCSSWPADAMC